MKGARRSLHFVPGGNQRMLQKGLELPADSLILDLEDSVTPALKEAARRMVCDWLKEHTSLRQERLVRINGLDSDWCRDDLAAVLEAGADGIVVPKVGCLGDVEAIDRLLIAHETARKVPAGSTPLLLIGTEVPAAVFNLTSTLGHPRVDGVAWAAEDLSAELGARTRRDASGNYLEVFQTVRSLCLLAAVAAGVQPIDGPFVDIGDPDGLRRECELTSSMGYTGKLTIHPGQIEIVNAAFMPSPQELARARELLAAFESNQAEGRMAFRFRGEMVDVPHRRRAEALLRRAALAESP